MGVGLGYFGEYHEAKNYFDKAHEKKPDSIVINNYKEFIDKIIFKYPYTPTEKPENSNKDSQISIPDWIKPVAKWWSEGQIEDAEFVKALHFLIENKIMGMQVIPADSNTASKIPDWIRENAGWWADGQINDESFVSGIQYMMENGIILIEISQ